MEFDRDFAYTAFRRQSGAILILSYTLIQRKDISMLLLMPLIFSALLGELKPDSEKLLFVSHRLGLLLYCCNADFTAVMYRKGKGRPLMYISALVLSWSVHVFNTDA